MLLEDLLDGAALAALDFLIHVEEAPAEALAEQPADGGLAATHEAEQEDLAADRNGSLRHRRRQLYQALGGYFSRVGETQGC